VHGRVSRGRRLNFVGGTDYDTRTRFVRALFVREPLRRRSIGGAPRLGGACHPMYPFMARAPRRRSRTA
jgi:hypothetical protein